MKYNPYEESIWQITFLFLMTGYIFFKLYENKKQLLSIRYWYLSDDLNPILE